MDEAITSWITSGDLPTCIQRAYDFQGQSPVYFVIAWLSRQMLGDTEIALRLPSLLAVIGSTFVFFHILKQFDIKDDAWIGTVIVGILLIMHKEVGLNARPYSLAIFFSLLSSYTLMRWLRHRKLLQFAIYVFTTWLMITLHYLFASIFCFHFLLTLFYRNRNKRDVSLFILAWVIIAILLLPFTAHLIQIAERSGRYDFNLKPNSLVGISKLFIDLCFLPALLVGSFFRVLKPRTSWRSSTISSTKIAFCWWCIGPVSVVALYWITGISLTSTRYTAWKIPAVAFISLISVKSVYTHRNVALPTLLLTLIGILHNQMRTDGWREAVEWAEHQQVEKNSVTLLYPRLIETADPDWIEDTEFQAYLASPISQYHWKGDIELLPVLVDERTITAAKNILLGSFESYNQVIFFARSGSELEEELKSVVSQTQFDIEKKNFGTVQVSIFNRRKTGV